MNNIEKYQNNNLEINFLEKYKNKIKKSFTSIASLASIIIINNETIKNISKKIENTLIPKAYANSWFELERGFVEGLNITDIYGELNFDVMFGEFDGKYIVNNYEIKQFDNNEISIYTNYREANIKLINPYILTVYAIKEKKRRQYIQKINFLIEKRHNFIYFLGIVLDNGMFLPFQQPLRYQINNVIYEIQNDGSKKRIISNPGVDININLPNIPHIGLKGGFIKLKIQ